VGNVTLAIDVHSVVKLDIRAASTSVTIILW
jgi:hypothetical protein